MFLMFGIIGSLTVMIGGNENTTVPEEGVLVIDLSKVSLAEQDGEADIMATIQGSEVTGKLGIWNAVQAINTAAEDPGIKFIYILPDGGAAGMSATEEIRAALSNFRSSGKPVIAYTESPSNVGYYLVSVSDKIYSSAHMGSMIGITGLASQQMYLKDALDKIGVNVQLIRHGKYKSAGEMFVRNSGSKENREQNQVMLNSIWNSMTAQIAESRGITQDEFNAMIDNLVLVDNEDLKENKLVDELYTREELRNQLAVLAGKEKYKDVNMIQIADYAKAKVLPNYKAKDKIAIIYANGDITEAGDPQSAVIGNAMASEISKVRADSTVKAVVFRVNSPGGSVFASEKIKNEIDLLRKDKPVIASYGEYAASGGYWISANCDYIFSDATTLTGSIGVFSMIPDLSKVAKDKLHIGVEFTKTNKHSDMMTIVHTLDAAEIAYMQKSVEDIYTRFTEIVSKGRGMTVEEVDNIAQGRVWAGADAINIGLVDQIGTLEDAVNFAMTAIGESTDLNDYQVVQYPKPLSMMEQLMSKLNGTDSEARIFKGTILEDVERAYGKWSAESTGEVLATMPYIYSIR